MYAIENGAGQIHDICESSFPSPADDNIPYVAPYANEISDGSDQSYNAVMRNLHEIDDNHTLYALITTPAVVAGEEIAWYYGRDYRRYGYRAARPPGRAHYCEAGDNVEVARVLLDGGRCNRECK